MENGINIWSCVCVCECVHMLLGLFIVLLLAGWAKCHDWGDQVDVPQEPWVPAHKERDLSSIKQCWNEDEPILFQILSGIQPDSPFASIPVSRLGSFCLLQHTWYSILSIWNPWSNCVTCLRGEVFEGRGCSAASPSWNHSHLLFQRPGSPDQLGHSEYKHTQHAKESEREAPTATVVRILYIPSLTQLYSVSTLVRKTMCLSPHVHLLCLGDLYLGTSPIW